MVWYLVFQKIMNLDPKDICFLLCYDDGYSEMARMTIDNNIKPYCRLHGYSLKEHLITEKVSGRDFQWQKIKITIDTLKKTNFKWLFFMDVDCLIMHTPIKLEDIIDENYSFILPSHNVGAIDTPITEFGEIKNIITSHIFVKNDEIGLKILEDIWRASDWPANKDINEFDHEARQTRITIQKKEFRDKIKIVEEKVLNRFWIMNSPFMIYRLKGVNENVWQPGDFSVHVTGYPKEMRMELLKDLLHFSCGLISNWEIKDGKIFFSPLVEICYTKINLFDINGKLLRYFELNNLQPQFEYYLIIEDLKKDEFRVEALDVNNKQISLKLLEK